jgi:hypothetical protein
VWSRNGDELFFLSPTVELMAAEYTVATGAFQPGRVSTLFPLPSQGPVVTASRIYDVASDGRFLMTRPASDAGPGDAAGPDIVLVKNFFELLRARVPK